MRLLLIVLFCLLSACATRSRAPQSDELYVIGSLATPIHMQVVPPPKACVVIAQTGQINASVWFAEDVDAKQGCSYRLTVTEGALQQLSAEPLQAILAHELAHYTLGHLAVYQERHQTKLAVKAFFSVVAQITWVGYIVGNVGSAVTSLVSNLYAREDETAADREGARLLSEASGTWTGLFRPSGCSQMAEALVLLWQHTGEQLWADYLGDHPALPRRIAEVQSYCGGLTSPGNVERSSP